MKFTKLSFSKIKWLINNIAFKKNPLSVIIKILIWEIFRKFGVKRSYIFDDNIKIYLYPNDGVARLTFYFNYHEPEIFKFLEKFINKIKEKQDELIYLDIGANIGLYSLFVAKRVQKRGKVIAFEPHPNTFDKLTENIRLNNFNNIIAINKALGNEKNFVYINQCEDSAKTFVSNLKTDQSEMKVEMVNLDYFLKENQIDKIDYVKIDVEGFEFYVLQGMKELLKNSPPLIIQIELYEKFLARSGSSLDTTVKFLYEFKYTTWKLNSNKIKLQKCKNDFSGDLFFINETNIKKLVEFLEE